MVKRKILGWLEVQVSSLGTPMLQAQHHTTLRLISLGNYMQYILGISHFDLNTIIINYKIWVQTGLGKGPSFSGPGFRAEFHIQGSKLNFSPGRVARPVAEPWVQNLQVSHSHEI